MTICGLELLKHALHGCLKLRVLKSTFASWKTSSKIACRRLPWRKEGSLNARLQWSKKAVHESMVAEFEYGQ